MEEKEIKVKITKDVFEDLKSKISNLNKEIKIIVQKDVYFDNELMIFTNLARGLRVRFNNSIPMVLDFKSLFLNPFSTPKKRFYVEEISMPLPLNEESVNKLNTILQRFGLPALQPEPNVNYLDLVKYLKEMNLEPKITLTKKREEITVDQVVYTFDYIKELGYFFEIETKDGSDSVKILNSLTGNNYAVIQKGYNEMAAVNLGNYISNDVQQLLFKINWNWNILETEKELVKDYFLKK